mgnify:CR=1 FL=1
MPSGVEHAVTAKQLLEERAVGNPLMPSGVEHAIDIANDANKTPVGNPLMPSGVEHDIAAARERLARQGGKSFDAVRR